jgi:hydroxyacylglutathione hydrolase
MYIEQIYTNCLAEASYYIESDGEVAIIDPMREAEPYLRLAEERGAKIKYVFETHFHADFISGHLDIARATGAKIIYGPSAKAEYDIVVAKDLEEFKLGRAKIKLLHTPGHTLESSCFLLSDERNITHSVFTGDTLFVGEVGRPDLAVSSQYTKEDLAGMLYDSINKKLKTLPDYVIVYPAHGAGSAFGKNISKELYSTIGYQKQFNYALKPMSKEEFVKVVTDGLAEPPKYFFKDAVINKKGYEPLDKVIAKNLNPLSLVDFEKEIRNGSVILDAREPDDFEKGYIAGAINIGMDGQYAIWAGSLIDITTPLLLVTDIGREKESILRLARVGFENVKGYLAGGIETWTKRNPSDKIVSIEPSDYIKIKPNNHITIDVRNQDECITGILPDAIVIPLNTLEREITKLGKHAKIYIYCSGGYRSMMASSLMKNQGFDNVVNISGGINKIRSAHIKLVNYN